MALPRFFHPDLPTQGAVELDGEEAQHASNSLRMNVGDPAILFDGQGHEARVTVSEVSRKRVVFAIETHAAISRELAGRIEMMIALPKGDRQKALVDGLVQLGVHRLTPLTTYRSVAKVNDKALERIRRWVMESSKQCGRNRLMDLSSETRLSDLQESGPTQEPASLKLFAHPYSINGEESRHIENILNECDSTTPICVLIGPEGGFTEQECEQLVESSWQPVSLGARILRVETAALSLAAQFAAKLETPIR